MAQKLENLIDKDLLGAYDDELKKTYLAGGIVFDISAHKATGNPATPATFASLTAAIGTNGANIPQNMRKGGMTVKFIKGSAQSQSNKYVQYRLKTQTFSTSEADWECIEDAVSALEQAVGTGGSVDERIAAEGARHYLKAETYTKTEVNGLVDTPHQEYVTVEHYADLPATGSADTIYRVSNWDGSADGGQGAVDATVYSEYAWDGVSDPSRYVFLCVKSQIGEVFDISVYNNNAVYADLAAALGTNGANVPESLRKGGMSVKFIQGSVQSSDNKYAQFRYMGTSTANADFTNVANWQGVDEKPTAGSKNLVESGGVYNREAIASGIDADVASVIPLLHSDITDPYVTHDTDCCYSSQNIAPLYSSVSVDVAINNNSGNIFKIGVKYHQFVKVRVVTDNPLTYKIKFDATNVSSDIVYNDKTYNTGEFYTVYVGSFLGKAGAVNNYKIFKPTSFDGATKARAQNIKAEYYGGYIIEDSVLAGVLDFDGLATLLDYTQNICHVQMDGRAVVGYNNANLALQKIGDLSIINVEDNSNASAAIEGVNRKIPVTNKFVSAVSLLPTDVVKGGGGSGSIGEDGEYYFEFVGQPEYSSPSVDSRNTYVVLPADKKYHIFAKMRLDLEDECVFKPSFNLPTGIKDINIVEQTIPGGKVMPVYIGSCVGKGKGGTFMVKYTNIKTPSGGVIIRSQNIKVSFYGAYVIPDEDLIGINNLSALAQCLTYGKLETVVSEFSISSGQSYYAESSLNSEHAVNSDMAIEATKIRNPYYQKLAGFYGDSLVTYTSTIIPRIFSYLGLNAGLVGAGGGQVNNIFSKQGFCTIERMALLPKNMKVLCFWGGANDGNYYVDRTQPDWIDHTKFGTINDQPLGVADMFNYRVTIANIDQKNTPGRTQTFYQAYKTLLRNFSILFPHTLVVCVSQYKSFYYVWNEGRDTVILKKDYPQKIAAEKECCEEYSIPFCDLYTKAGVSLSNCFDMLYDDGGSLIHPTSWLGERAINLIAQCVKDNMFLTTPTDAWTYDFIADNGVYRDKDVRELKEYLVDLRSEDEYNAMTLSEAIQGFIDYTTEHSITLKNNMYLVFYVNQYGTSAGYFLINKDNPTSTDSWEQWTDETIYDMRQRDNTLEIDYGVQTLSEAITSFMHKAEVEGWTYSNLMYMYFLTDVNGSWSMYRLTTPATPSSTGSWTFVKSGQANT